MSKKLPLPGDLGTNGTGHKGCTEKKLELNLNALRATYREAGG